MISIEHFYMIKYTLVKISKPILLIFRIVLLYYFLFL
jgi:hypothetical protein